MKIIITGASSGIGKSIAYSLAKHIDNATLWLLARRYDRLEQMQEELEKTTSAKIKIAQVDVRDLKSVIEFTEKVKADWDSVDVLINNAGLALGMAPIHQGDIEDWNTMIDTNVKGLLYMTRHISPLMVAQKHGHIINIGSTAGKMVYANGNVYSATKYAVDGLSQSMRIDLLPYNVKVTSINPGMVETEFSEVRFKGDKQAAQKVYQDINVLTPDDIANMVLFCVNQPPHVCINDVILTCTQQANSVYKKMND